MQSATAHKPSPEVAGTSPGEGTPRALIKQAGDFSERAQHAAERAVESDESDADDAAEAESYQRGPGMDSLIGQWAQVKALAMAVPLLALNSLTECNLRYHRVARDPLRTCT